MFNTHNYHKTVHESPDTIEIHEHRAPTDKSVELLNEMQEKAFKNVIASFRTSFNGFYTDGVFIKSTMHPHLLFCHFTFGLNGKIYNFDTSIDASDWGKALWEEKENRWDGIRCHIPFDFLKQKIAEIIAVNVLGTGEIDTSYTGGKKLRWAGK